MKLIVFLSTITLFLHNISATGTSTSTRDNQWFLKPDSTLWVYGVSGESDSLRAMCPHPENKQVPMQCGSDKWLMISGVDSHEASILGIKQDSTLWGWGENRESSIGPGGKLAQPTQIGTDKWLSVILEYSSAMGIKADSTLWRWGKSHFAELPGGDTPCANEC